MTQQTNFQQRLASGQRLVLAEVSPPIAGNSAPVREIATRYAGKVHALGVSDNREHVGMSALAAASIVASEDVEPILHIVTRDRNRIALVSECLGAKALGIHNVLCTTGTHQTLGRFRAAKNVFDVDSIQLLQIYQQLGTDGAAVGEDRVCENGDGALCLGGTAAPYADPMELQVMRLGKKVASGATFLITQPVFSLERFEAWWKEVTQRGIHESCAIIAGIRILTDADGAKDYAQRRPLPMVPDATLERIASKADKAAQRQEGIEIAVETIKHLSALNGLRGFEICGDGDDDAVLEVIDKSGLRID